MLCTVWHVFGDTGSICIWLICMSPCCVSHMVHGDFEFDDVMTLAVSWSCVYYHGLCVFCNRRSCCLSFSRLMISHLFVLAVWYRMHCYNVEGNENNVDIDCANFSVLMTLKYNFLTPPPTQLSSHLAHIVTAGKMNCVQWCMCKDVVDYDEWDFNLIAVIIVVMDWGSAFTQCLKIMYSFGS